MTQSYEIFESNQYLNSCPECHNGVIADNVRAETICSTCGLVLSEKHIIKNKITRNMFVGDVDFREFDNPLLSIGISKTYFNVKKNSNSEYKRLKLVNTWQKDGKEHNLFSGLPQILLIISQLQLPFQIRDKVVYLYRKALEKSLFRGRSKIGVICASVYYACRISKIPLTIIEISQKTLYPEKKIRLHLKIIILKLKLKFPPLNPEIYISKFCRCLSLPYEIERKIFQLLQKVPYTYFLGKSPRACLGGLIYYICKDTPNKRTQKQIADITNNVDLSIRTRYQDLKRLLEK